MTYNVFSGTLNPTQSVCNLKKRSLNGCLSACLVQVVTWDKMEVG